MDFGSGQRSRVFLGTFRLRKRRIFDNIEELKGQVPKSYTLGDILVLISYNLAVGTLTVPPL